MQFEAQSVLLQAAAVLSVVVVLAFVSKFKTLTFRKRRSTISYTPPRSLSPEKQSPPSSSYAEIFPPHRREALEQCHLAGSGSSAVDLSKQDPNHAQPLSDKQSVDATPDHHLTATGFSVNEINRLGSFPNYAALSGVPLPSAYSEFNLTKAKPRPYRPLRWAYHQTMGKSRGRSSASLIHQIALHRMEPDWWLELESTYADRISQRQELFRKHGKTVLQALPGSELATRELMEMCLQFVCARYPQHFSLDVDTMTFHNGILGTTANLKIEEPLHVLLNHIPEDFACMIRDPETGIYSFRAGIICSSLGWNVGSKIGLKLHEIHAPIPDYREKMQRSMDRYFAKMPTDKPIQRGSWGLEIDEPLFMPPGDPHEVLREAQDPTHTIDRCNLRVDWQTLRRLPLSGSIVFNFKALFTPVTEFRDEPYIPSLMLKVLKEGKKELMQYKSTWHTEHVVIPAMEQYEREQIEKGLIPKDWEPRTLDESPYFPGWEEKWHRQQGF